MRVFKDERGTILLATIIFLTLFLMLAGFIADFMRAFVVKRELQDALDAAVISATQSEEEQSRSNYIFSQGEYKCSFHKGSKTCSCENWKTVHKKNEKTIEDPSSLAKGKCVKYVGEAERWIDYGKGSSVETIATKIFKYNKDNSRIIQKNLANGKLSGVTPAFYVYNNRNDPRYPSVAGEINASLKTTFLSKIVSRNIPIKCKAQATTHYVVIEKSDNKGAHKVPADAWPNPGSPRTGTAGQRNIPQ